MKSCLKTILILACICLIIPFLLYFLTAKEFIKPTTPQSDTLVLVETVYIEKNTPKTQKKQKTNITIEAAQKNSQPKQRVKNRQYIEVEGPLGNVELYNGMPKEEVRELLGKPDNSTMMDIIGDIHESWKYRSKGCNLSVDFINGKLTAVINY